LRTAPKYGMRKEERLRLLVWKRLQAGERHQHVDQVLFRREAIEDKNDIPRMLG